MRRRADPALDDLRTWARPLRYRMSKDAEGFPIIPGRYGRIEWFDGRDLAVYCERPASSRSSGRSLACAGTRPETTRCGRSSRPRPLSRSRG